MIVTTSGELLQEDITMRTLGMHQPFAALMLYGKIETRWVIEGKKPPFPLGKYLIYSTKKILKDFHIFDYVGSRDMMKYIWSLLVAEEQNTLRGYAIATGELIQVVPLLKFEEDRAFVKVIGSKVEDGVKRIQWGLHFGNVQRIKPFEWKHGGQGVGRVPLHEMSKIIPI